MSGVWLESVGWDVRLHSDFGTEWRGAPNGIPFVSVPPNQPRVPVKFEYADESDTGPYRTPADVPIERGKRRSQSGGGKKGEGKD
jgi:hypothetical protein